ncbi:MAG: NADH-quinone oxidoreductase subunit I [Dehalococcoidia bacterium]|nr:NADH-quinone oxidoreductase subunit I [Dehalococcoidia bacterium]
MKLERFGLGLAKGLALTSKHLFRKKITTEYPDQKLSTSRRIRGQQFVWKEELCTGCSTCAKSCPHGIIEIVTARNSDNRYSVEKFEIDIGRCMFCGLCIEVCPYNALFLGRSYEQSQYSRRLLWASKEMLKLPDSARSAYGHAEIEDQIPVQSLLIYGQLSSEMVEKNDN